MEKATYVFVLILCLYVYLASATPISHRRRIQTSSVEPIYLEGKLVNDIENNFEPESVSNEEDSINNDEGKKEVFISPRVDEESNEHDLKQDDEEDVVVDYLIEQFRKCRLSGIERTKCSRLLFQSRDKRDERGSHWAMIKRIFKRILEGRWSQTAKI